MPTDCPVAHQPKVRRADAYCEPPPNAPCPKGSHWTSTSVADVYCEGGDQCAERECPTGSTCLKTSLCVKKMRYRRIGFYEIVAGSCSTQADCAEGTECVTTRRCDPAKKRVHPKGVANPAAGVVAAPADEPSSSATPMLGTGSPSAGVIVLPDPGQPAPGEPGSQPPAGATPANGCASCATVPVDRSLPWGGPGLLLLAAGLRRRRR